jgi:hypothetical protein
VTGQSTARRHTLEPLVGEWSLAVVPPGVDRPDELPDVGARNVWEWLGESDLLVQRWTVPVPEAPDGVAVIGWDESRSGFVQHYFDERGVVRLYELSLEGGKLTLERTRADFSPLHFSQRYVGTLTEDGRRIDGAWYIAHDHETWEKDFDLVYTRVEVT